MHDKTIRSVAKTRTTARFFSKLRSTWGKYLSVFCSYCRITVWTRVFVCDHWFRLTALIVWMAVRGGLPHLRLCHCSRRDDDQTGDAHNSPTANKRGQLERKQNNSRRVKSFSFLTGTLACAKPLYYTHHDGHEKRRQSYTPSPHFLFCRGSDNRTDVLPPPDLHATAFPGSIGSLRRSADQLVLISEGYILKQCPPQANIRRWQEVPHLKITQ